MSILPSVPVVLERHIKLTMATSSHNLHNNNNNNNNNNNIDSNTFQILNNLYHSPTSNLFLVRDTQKLYDAAKKLRIGSNITHEDVEQFKQKIESIARTKAAKRMNGRIGRRFSFRKYKLYGSTIIAGDLAFIPRISKVNEEPQKGKAFILCVLMDVFSRKISLNFMKDAKSKTTLQTFKKSLKEDFGASKFTHFLSDRG